MTVDANESLVLDQDFKSSYSMPLNPDDCAWRNGIDRASDGGRDINPVVKRSCEGTVRQYPCPEWR